MLLCFYGHGELYICLFLSRIFYSQLGPLPHSKISFWYNPMENKLWINLYVVLFPPPLCKRGWMFKISFLHILFLVIFGYLQFEIVIQPIDSFSTSTQSTVEIFLIHLIMFQIQLMKILFTFCLLTLKEVYFLRRHKYLNFQILMKIFNAHIAN